jgi:hypothetical protein
VTPQTSRAKGLRAAWHHNGVIDQIQTNGAFKLLGRPIFDALYKLGMLAQSFCLALVASVAAFSLHGSGGTGPWGAGAPCFLVDCAVHSSSVECNVCVCGASLDY